MSYQYRNRGFRRSAPTAAPVPGDVHHWWPDGVDHGKYHLCISYDYEFLWLNKAKDRRFRDDIAIAADDIRFIRERPERLSFVSSQPIIPVGGPREFGRLSAELVGNVTTSVLMDVLSELLMARTTDPQDARRVREVMATIRDSGLT